VKKVGENDQSFRAGVSTKKLKKAKKASRILTNCLFGGRAAANALL
jgi:hypothetical protein